MTVVGRAEPPLPARASVTRLPVSGLLAAAFLATLTLAAPESASAQCSMCRTALEQNPEAAAGFNRAILFLLLMPYTVFGALTAIYLRSRRRSAPAPAAAPARPEFAAGPRLAESGKA